MRLLLAALPLLLTGCATEAADPGSVPAPDRTAVLAAAVETCDGYLAEQRSNPEADGFRLDNPGRVVGETLVIDAGPRSVYGLYCYLDVLGASPSTAALVKKAYRQYRGKPAAEVSGGWLWEWQPGLRFQVRISPV